MSNFNQWRSIIDGEPLASAIPDSVIDDFEHNALQDYYGGDTNFASIIDSNPDAHQGEFWLEIDADDSARTVHNEQGAENLDVNNYPQRGEEFEFAIRVDSSDDVTNHLIFAHQDTTDLPAGGEGYAAGLYNEELLISTMDDIASGSPSVTVNGDFSLQTVYEMTVDFGKTESDDITASVIDDSDNEITATLTDNQYDSGAIAWGVNRQSTGVDPLAYFDAPIY